MSYDFYRMFHLVGVFMILIALGGVALHVASGGTREFANRKWIAILHGVGLLIAGVGGFGLLARLNFMSPIPGWAWTKIVIWLLLGGAPALVYKKKELAKPFWFATLVLSTLATWLAIFKPY